MEFSLFIRVKYTLYYGKEVKDMILFTILLIMLVALAAFLLTITGVLGGATLLAFGDIIVFVFIIALIIKLFRRKK